MPLMQTHCLTYKPADVYRVREPFSPVDNKKAEAYASAAHLVAPTGFEPATFALRGRRPKPLDDGAIKKAAKHVAWVSLVAPTGFEPATFALRGRRPKPLDDGAIK